MRQCVIRIGFYSFLLQHSSPFVITFSKLEERRLCTKMEIVGREGRCAKTDGSFPASRVNAPANRGSNRPDDVVLEGKDVVHISVVPLRPHVTAGKRVNELSGKSHSVANAADATFQYELGAQLTADALHVNILASILEGGVARDDNQQVKARQLGNDVFGDSVAEILLLGIAAHVGEGQNSDRRFRGDGFD